MSGRAGGHPQPEQPPLGAAGVEASPAPVPSRNRARLTFAIKLAVTAGALAFAFSRVAASDFSAAAGRLTVPCVAAAIAFTVTNLAVAALRWRVLLWGYGAKHVPSLAFLFRAQLVGHFYNTLVPGSVTGDVLRGHATRTSFDGPLSSYVVVGVERFFGLAGLFAVGALGLVARPLPGVVRADLLAALALGTALGIGLVPIAGRSLGRFLPGRVGRWAASLPAVEHPAALVLVFAISLVTHTLVALTGHVLVSALAPEVALSSSLVLVPLAMIATYVPFSVAGLGVREAAFVFLYGKIGVGPADATLASLSFTAVYALVAAVGGIVHLAWPLRAEAETPTRRAEADQP